MKSLAVRGLLIGVVVAVVLVAPLAQAKGNDPGSFFNTVHELKGPGVDRLRETLIAVGSECTKLEKRCPAAEELFSLLTNDFNMSGFPTLLVYIDADSRVRTNVLVNKNRVTPFLYGQRNVWVAVFSEHRLDLEARLTALWRQRKSTLSTLDGVFVTEGQKTVEGRKAQEEVGTVVFERLSGDGVTGDLYYGSVRFFLEPLAVYSITVAPIEGPSDIEPEFVELMANFSNSSSQSLGFGLGLGATLRTDEVDDLILDGVSFGSANLDLYLALDIYIIKPAVLAPMKQSIWGRYRPSIGVSVGTNIQFWEAKEFFLGVSFGHVIGRHGLVVGVNIIDASSETEEDRIVRPYIGAVFRL